MSFQKWSRWHAEKYEPKKYKVWLRDVKIPIVREMCEIIDEWGAFGYDGTEVRAIMLRRRGIIESDGE